MSVAVVGVLGAAGAAFIAGGAPADASLPLARAVLQNAAGVEIGEVVFKGRGRHADRVVVRLRLPADAPGLGAYHGLHVHTTGTCTAPTFASAGGHWNVGAARPHGHHTGDLPSVLVSAAGRAYAKFETERFSVDQLFDQDGSAVVLHAGPDNFGNVPLGAGRYEDPNNWYNSATGTANTGDAGARYACGTVLRAP